jgi:hypothetical protein
VGKHNGNADCGNWVAKKFISIPALLAIIFAGLSYVSLGQRSETAIRQ